MKKLKIVFLCGCLLLMLASCTNDDVMSQDVQIETVESSLVFSQLKDILIQNVSNETSQGDVYVLFDSSDESFCVLSEEEYLICVSISDFLSNDKEPQKAPKGNGWKKSGTYKKNIFSVSNAIDKLKGEIPKNQNFEIHVEYSKDGKTFTVWWRPV